MSDLLQDAVRRNRGIGSRLPGVFGAVPCAHSARYSGGAYPNAASRSPEAEYAAAGMSLTPVASIHLL
jgi:hypothetical protein